MEGGDDPSAAKKARRDSGESKESKKARREAREAKDAAADATAPGAASSSSAPPPAAPVAVAAVTAAVAPAALPKLPTEESLPHLCCSVCLSFPEKEVLQCSSGHILCDACHERVLMEDKPVCPTCRAPLDSLKPIRNVLAEQTLALLPVHCENSGCTAKLTRGGLATHLKTECQHRLVKCKYHPLGCKWEGVHKEAGTHMDRCKKAELPGWKLLKKVVDKQAADAAAAEAAAAEAKVGLSVLKMLSSRCRNIEVSHIALHKCSALEHVAGKPAHLVSASFQAIGFRWKLFTVHDPASGYHAVLQLRDSRVPLPVDFFVMRGAGIDERVSPAVGSHTFVSKKRSSEPVRLASGEAASGLSDLDAMTLRIGMADKRPGRVLRDFLGQPAGGGWGPEGPDVERWDDERSDGDGSMEEEMDDDEGMYSDDLSSISGEMEGPGHGGRGRHYHY